MSRVTVMLQALTAPGSPAQNHTKLSSAARCVLHVWLVNDWEDLNWWFNQIGIPLFATSQLLMLVPNNKTGIEQAFPRTWNDVAILPLGSGWDYNVIGRHVDRPHLERITIITPNWIRSFAQLVPSKDIQTKLLNWADRLASSSSS
ncbi:hypothetical protein I4U23_031195 [Adineta vaga]|nr:hypothetical protein I4U23_031195 [Adineta vaga]